MKKKLVFYFLISIPIVLSFISGALFYHTLKHGFNIFFLIGIFIILFMIFLKYFYKENYKYRSKTGDFTLVLENIPAAILLISNREIIYVNEAGVRMLRGKSKEQIVGRSPLDFVPEEQKERSIRRTEAFEKGVKELPVFRGRLKRLDGTYIWVETLSRLVNFHGKTVIQSTVWDISKLKEAEEALVKANTHLKNIYNSTNMMIFSLDREYRYINFNRLYKEKMKEIWNVDVEEGRNVLEFIEDMDLRKKAREKFDRVLSGEYIEEKQEFKFFSEKKYLWIIYSPLKNNKDIIIGLSVFIRDITSEISAKKEMIKLLKVIETSPQGIAIFDKEMKILYINKTVLKLGNWDSKKEILGEKISNFLRERDIPVLINSVFPHLMKGEVWKGELFLYKKDRSLLLTEVYASAVFNDEGEVEDFFILFSDITERRRMENELKEAYEFTKTVLSSIPAAIFSKDREGKYLLVNEEFAEYVGMSPEEIRGKTVEEICPLEESSLYHKRDMELMEKDGDEIYEGYLPHVKKGNIPGVFHKSCFHDARGKVAGLVGIFVDLTELRIAQRALRDSEERSKAILDAMPDILFILDREGRFLSYHAPEKDVFLIPREEFLNKKIEEVFPPFLVEKTRKAMKEVEEKNEISIYEYSIELKEREKHWFEARMVRKSENEFLVIIRDVTKNKKLEAQLIQAQKMETIGTLAGGVAHDFNNLLTVINGYCELGLEKIKSENSNVKKEIEAIHSATKKAIKLVSQLLAFSRKQLIAPELLNVNTVIKELYSMLKRLIPEDIKLGLNLSKEELIIKIDPSQIEQILVNLVVNAKDAIIAKDDNNLKRTIFIETSRVELDEKYTKLHRGSREGVFVLISVSDSGIGMSEEIKQKVFEPFFTTKERGEGTGLGLSTVYGIVKQNKGFIYLYSEEGKGTTVKVYFPFIEEKVKFKKSKEKDSSWEEKGKGETILIVEDEDDVRKFLKEALNSLSYNVIEAKNGKEALKIFEEKEGKINLIITDLIMPEMSGEQLYREIKKKNSEVKIIFTSGYTGNQISDENILNKDVNFLSKPYKISDLFNLVRKVLKDD